MTTEGTNWEVRFTVGGLPAAAQGFDEADGGDVALGGDLIGLAFGLEAGAFGVEEFEVADGAMNGLNRARFMPGIASGGILYYRLAASGGRYDPATAKGIFRRQDCPKGTNSCFFGLSCRR